MISGEQESGDLGLSREVLVPTTGPLVAAQQQRIGEKLNAHFADSDVYDQLSISASAQMLEAKPAAITAAAIKAGVIDVQQGDGFYSIALRGYKIGTTSVSFMLGEPELRKLNGWPELTARNLGDIAEALDVARTAVGEIARSDEIYPLFTMPKERKLINFTPNPQVFGMGGWYDLDQIDKIRQGVEKLNAPEGFIGQSAIIGSLGISPVAFEDIRRRLEIEGRPFRNPDIGQGEYHFKEPDVIKLLMFVRDARRNLRNK